MSEQAVGLPPLRCEKTGQGDIALEALQPIRRRYRGVWGNGTRWPGGASISRLFSVSKARCLCCYFAKFITFS